MHHQSPKPRLLKSLNPHTRDRRQDQEQMRPRLPNRLIQPHPQIQAFVPSDPKSSNDGQVSTIAAYSLTEFSQSSSLTSTYTSSCAFAAFRFTGPNFSPPRPKFANTSTSQATIAK